MQLFWILFEGLATLFQAFLFTGFARLFLGSKQPKAKDAVSYVAASLVLFGLISVLNFATHFEGAAGLIYIIPVFLYAFFFLEGSPAKKLVASITPSLVCLVASSVMFDVIAAVFSTTIEDIISIENAARLMFVISANLLNLYILFIVLKFGKKETFRLGKVEAALSALVLILTILIFTAIDLGVIDLDVDLSIRQSVLLLSALIGLILINLVTFYFMIRISKSNEMRLQNSVLQQKLLYQNQYALELKRQYQTALHMQHDIKHNLSVLNILIREANYEKAAALLDEYMRSGVLIKTWVNTDNAILNAVINMKFSYADSLGIRTFCALPQKFDLLGEADLCVLFGNMLDNAIEHCKKHKNKESQLSVEINSDGLHSIILVKNTCYTPARLDTSEIKTTKKDKTRHGFGIKSIKSIVQKYDALFDCYENNGMFYCKVIL